MNRSLKFLGMFCLTLVFATQAYAMDLAGKSFSFTDGKSKISVKRVGTDKGTAQFNINFGPNTTPLLGDNDFSIVTQGGQSFTGTYSVDAKGKVTLTPNEQSYEAFLALLVADAITTVDPTIQSLTNVVADITKQKASFKAKEGKNGTSVSMSVSVKMDVNGIVDGVNESSTASMSVSAKTTVPNEPAQGGEDPSTQPGLAGSTWNVTSKISGALQIKIVTTTSIPKLKPIKVKIKDSEQNILINLGPNQIVDLQDTEFNVETGEGEIFIGSYTIDSKGKMTFTPVSQNLKDYVDAIVSDDLQEALNKFGNIPGIPFDLSTLFSNIQLDVAVSNIKGAGKIKAGKSMNMDISFDFSATLGSAGFQLEISGNLKYSAKGNPAN